MSDVSVLLELKAAKAEHALLGALNLLCLDGHHAAGLARVSSLEELDTGCVLQLPYVSDALLVDAGLLLSLLAHPLNYLHPPYLAF